MEFVDPFSSGSRSWLASCIALYHSYTRVIFKLVFLEKCVELPLKMYGLTSTLTTAELPQVGIFFALNFLPWEFY